MALSRARSLRAVGDEEGHLVWKAVAERVGHLRPRPTAGEE
jgi:hypothetical protein